MKNVTRQFAAAALLACASGASVAAGLGRAHIAPVHIAPVVQAPVFRAPVEIKLPPPPPPEIRIPRVIVPQVCRFEQRSDGSYVRRCD